VLRTSDHSRLFIVTLGLILLVASVVVVISRRLRLPRSIGLVEAGILLALLRGRRSPRF
jgi:Kef-type K+ transport system membrane component KefB